jgi:hypothetical protein
MLDRSVRSPFTRIVKSGKEACISIDSATLHQRDYSLAGLLNARAVEIGLANAEWYRTEIPQNILNDCSLPHNSFGACHKEIIPTFLRQAKDPEYFVRRRLPLTARPTSPMPSGNIG